MDLLNSNYIEKGFVDSVLKREEIYSTEIAWGIALPHGDPQFVKKSCLAVNILENQLDWGRENVDTVFLLCISMEDRGKLKKWMRGLYNFLEIDENRVFLKNAKSSEEIYNIMEEFIDVD